ncbi:MAG TPA: hypothetical protein VH853_15105 [Polyangia bacterium]|nr:hypothetical protein [Polyangia bacterium]
MVAILVAGAARATPAAAQACCAGGALVSPVRLAAPEDYAVGLQTRARNDMGEFQADGRFVSSSGEETEQDLEQDLAASFRLARRAQVGLVLPYIETHRTELGVDDWGSGIGDLALNARYDFKLAAEMMYWPGFALLGGVVFPTGKAVGDGTNPASTDATGTGTTSVSLGVDLEKVHGPLYAALYLWASYSASNTVTPGSTSALTTSYPLQLTALAVAGYVFQNEAAAALYINFLERGDTSINGATQPESGLRLTTVGATGLFPIAVDWRLSASIYTDLLFSSFGRNEQAGAGLTVSLVRAWR